MKKLKVSLGTATLLVASILSVFVTSCEKEEVAKTDNAAISAAEKEQFKTLGFDVSDIKKDGANYVLEGDIVITPETFKAMQNDPILKLGANGEQYRTNNLVSQPRTIRIRSASGVSTKISTGIDQAISRYNALGLTLTFTRVASTAAADITVRQATGSAGGVAGFPSGGNPYNSVTVYSSTNNYAQAVVTHVVTHEIGHCLGLRHSDYFNRSLSCGSGGNEGASTVGAVHIPGTPTGFDSGSVMNSCFSTSSTGVFSSYDRIALQYIY